MAWSDPSISLGEVSTLSSSGIEMVSESEPEAPAFSGVSGRFRGPLDFRSGGIEGEEISSCSPSLGAVSPGTTGTRANLRFGLCSPPSAPVGFLTSCCLASLLDFAEVASNITRAGDKSFKAVSSFLVAKR